MIRRYLIGLLLIISGFSATVNLFGDDNNNQEINYKLLPPHERWELVRNQIRRFQKSLQEDERHDVRKETIINGNQIRVLLTNQGSISTPDADAANADLVWPNGPSGLGYAYEFGPLVGAEVIGGNGDTLRIVDDGFILLNDGDYEPGTANKWGWEPKLGFSDPASNEVATFSDLDRNNDGKPDSWPQSWFNEILGRYVWPAFLGDDATTPDEEVFYKMDDFDQAEFGSNIGAAGYYPFPDDSSAQGLGLELEVRIFQFNNPLAEDLIFLVYTITNVSPKTLDKVYLGMFGDPHVGGPNDFADDNAGFISAFDPDFADRPNVRNMLYAWDNDGIGDGGRIPGYFGYRFMESPGIDNDAGVFTFRSDFGVYREPGFAWTGDEDGDWIEEFDDVGVDGIAGTGDFGEGDSKPNQLFYLDLNGNSMIDAGEPTSETREEGMRFFGGEPNFGFLDIAESDQLGLTSFNAILFGGDNRPRNDALMWDLISTPNQRPGDPPPVIEQESDNVFIYGSGSFPLKPGESQRFSIALLMGVDFDDLLQNAETSQQVFESDYRFAQAPNKPKLVAVPGDKKVTLYWDTGAEESFDPFVARANPDTLERGFDFEGYRVYRSRDWSFNDTQTITDSRGIPFLSVPLRQLNGLAAQFDLINEFSGLSEIEYIGRGVRYDLGNNTGLRHSFVDSNNVKNGVTYFYAVTSYDHGDINAELAPTESQRVIQRDATTRLFTFDVNTAMVIPGGPAQGYIEPSLNNGEDNNFATREVGNATGTVWVEFIDALLVKDQYQYDVLFEEVEIDSFNTQIGFSVINLQDQTSVFVSRDTLWVNIITGVQLVEGSVSIREFSGALVDTSFYEVDHVTSRVRGTSAGSLPSGESFEATFKVKPVASSTSVQSEDDNPVFEGVKIFVQDDLIALDSLSTFGGRSGFKAIETNTNFSDEFTEIGLAEAGNPQPFPSDFEIRFTNYDTSANGNLINPADSAVITNVKSNFQIIDTETSQRVDFFIQETNPSVRNGRWDWQETIILIRPDWQQFTETTYQVDFSPPVDTNGVLLEPPIYPGDGDVFLLFSTKSFVPGDKYSFETKAAKFNQEIAKSALDDIIVVPDPYVAFSSAEIAGVRQGDRDDRRIEFRNLPPKCTIRIYNIVGEFVDEIIKDDTNNFAAWDLLSFESQEIAYGVYIYHVDAPGIGEKIGRFGVIK
jgi:hypothetical protein